MSEEKKTEQQEKLDKFQNGYKQSESEKMSLGEAYFKKRITDEMHVTDATNTIKIWRNDAEKKENVLVDFKIFSPCEKGVSILIYSLDRMLITYKGDSNISKDYKLIRLHTPRIDDKGKEHKYHIPKGAGTYPYIPPGLIDKYEKKEKIKTLVLTEGAFKTHVGWMKGFDIIGLTSISHYKDAKTGTLHSDIIKIILTCQVENIIWLADADANQISLKAFDKGEDLYKRPNFFFSSAAAIKRLLDDYDVHKYFAYVNPDLPEAAVKNTAGEDPSTKGLDDLLLAFPGKEKEIYEDLISVSKSPAWFWREDMSYSADKIRKHFRLHKIDEFVEFHSEQLREQCKKQGLNDFPDLKKKEFVWNGTKYKWDEGKNEAKIVVPGDAKNYFRVGDHYYEKILIPNKYGDLDKTFHRRMKQTIVDDYGKNFVEHIAKHKAFCNVPSHINYQEVMHNCYNMYHPFDHAAEEGECPYTLKFLQHIFGSGTVKVQHKDKGTIEVKEVDLGLDYVQLLYQRPQQMLPILCLVSKENNTGKTTFGKWLRCVFTQNVAIVGNADLANDFNGHWAGKLVVVCDETKIDKLVVVEKIKSLSTSDKVFINQKGKDQNEIEFFAKFILNSNNEENFIYASDEDVRYWIRKVPVIQDLFIGMLDEMKDEIPCFLNYLDKRKLATENMHRAWFYPELIKTDALKKVISFSRSTVEKEIRTHIRDMFFDHGAHEIFMTPDDINETFLKKKYEKNYLRNVLEEHLKVEQFHVWVYDGVEFDTVEKAKEAAGEGFVKEKLQKRYKTKRYAYPKFERLNIDNVPKVERVHVSCNGRPYVFKLEKFLTKDEIESRWIDPETLHDAKLLADGEKPKSWGQKQAAMELNGEKKQDDLPF
jgi:hypothetical protein